jgi:hypothetical protein
MSQGLEAGSGVFVETPCSTSDKTFLSTPPTPTKDDYPKKTPTKQQSPPLSLRPPAVSGLSVDGILRGPESLKLVWTMPTMPVPGRRGRGMGVPGQLQRHAGDSGNLGKEGRKKREKGREGERAEGRRENVKGLCVWLLFCFSLLAASFGNIYQQTVLKGSMVLFLEKGNSFLSIFRKYPLS